MKIVLRSFVCIFLYLAAATFAADTLNFSGSYTLTGSKGSMRFEKGNVKTLSVVQTETSIEVTESEGGRRNANIYPLNAQEGTFLSPGGIKGTCTGQFKKNFLILESVVTTRRQANGPAVQIHTKQKWESSPDHKTLTIRFDVDSPQSPINLVEPWTEIYTRN
jgi:hypothetical protein